MSFVDSAIFLFFFIKSFIYLGIHLFANRCCKYGQKIVSKILSTELEDIMGTTKIILNYLYMYKLLTKVNLGADAQLYKLTTVQLLC